MPAAYKRLLSTGDVARRMRISIQTVIRMCDDGILPHVRLPTPGKFRKIREEDAEQFAREHNLPWDPMETEE